MSDTTITATVDHEDLIGVLNAATTRMQDLAHEAKRTGDAAGEEAWVRRINLAQQLFDEAYKAKRAADLPEELKRPRAASVLHLRANLDRNGNPRRAFAVFAAGGAFLACIDEGYEGEQALYAQYPEARDIWPVQVDVPVSEYKRFLRRIPTGDVAAIDQALSVQS